ncbi:MAG TPA: 7-cyano-7-deazaguanine synthase, partial [Thermoplasmata archaeon]|nr:7-cyano-7-deazaguanine synthase [Thermoplasmata archaeon]
MPPWAALWGAEAHAGEVDAKALVLLSGGIDSAVCLWWARKQGWDLLPLTVDYHARPAAEVRAVRSLLAA